MWTQSIVPYSTGPSFSGEIVAVTVDALVVAQHEQDEVRGRIGTKND